MQFVELGEPECRLTTVQHSVFTNHSSDDSTEDLLMDFGPDCPTIA